MISLKGYDGDTSVPNRFIDEYMPRANGEFVKIYLYLLRVRGKADEELTLSHMADIFQCTEGDILRALRYWEREGLVINRLDDRDELLGIRLLYPDEIRVSPKDARERGDSMRISPETTASSYESGRDYFSDIPTREGEETPPPRKTDTSAPDKGSIAPSRMAELRKDEDVVSLLFLAEQCLSKTLSPTEMEKIIYFYDELHMSPDLIEYLIGYCATKNHKSIRYMEKVALSWAENGITTVEMAKKASSKYSKEYFDILKMMGISGRNPIDQEISYMDTWLKTYGFSLEIISEACTRAVMKTGTGSFQYAEGILKDWHEKNIHSLSDIKLVDEKHQKDSQRQKNGQGQKNAQGQKNQSAPNRFNNFKQREYDYKDYEKRLLNKDS